MESHLEVSRGWWISKTKNFEGMNEARREVLEM